jgi:hypothetical protein
MRMAELSPKSILAHGNSVKLQESKTPCPAGYVKHERQMANIYSLTNQLVQQIAAIFIDR